MLIRTSSAFGPLFQLSDSLDRWFDPPRGAAYDSCKCESPSDVAWLPAVDVTAGEKEIFVRAEVPGVNPENIEVTVTGRVLTIAGEKLSTFEKSEERMHYAERRFGSFRRVIKLPTAVDTESITASHADGVVEIRLNKSQAVLPKRIPVEVVKK